MINLKDFRELELNMTQEGFADFIAVTVEEIQAIEKGEKTIDLNILMKIANATGKSMDEIVGYQKQAPKSLNVEDTWESSNFIKKTITSYIANNMKNFTVAGGNQYIPMLQELDGMVGTLMKKPTIAVVGMSDAGKSKLINTLIDADKMPTSWTPTTSISVHLKHIEERPNFMQEEAWIYRASVGGKEEWDLNKCHEEEYCKRWKLTSGDAELLSQYGTRQGEKDKEGEVGSAVIYIDSPLLKVCDIVDLPGFGTGDRETDDRLAERSKDYADIVIYMSIANGFLRGTDIEFLKTAVNALPIIENPNNGIDPLGNLFIVASQAHIVDKGNKVEAKQILDAGCGRFYKEVPKEIWENRKEASGVDYTEAAIRKRFFTYTTDIAALRTDFETDLRELLERLPNILKERVRETIKNYISREDRSLDKEIDHYYKIINEREKIKTQYEALRANEPYRMNENIKNRRKVVGEIEKFNHKTKDAFERVYGSMVTVDGIVEIIEEQGYKKKKEDIEKLCGFISSSLQAKLQKILKEESTELTDVINQYIKDFNLSISQSKEVDLEAIGIPFDTIRVFAGGLAGLGTFGALAIWASTLGNLGGYILVAKGVSILSALGISVGGTAAAASAVAALGGPVVLGVALAVIAAIAAFSIFGGFWKKSIGKQILKEYTKNGALDKYIKVMEDYWEDTEVAFNAAADELENQWKQHLNKLEATVMTYSLQELEERINKAKEVKDFLAGMPL